MIVIEKMLIEGELWYDFQCEKCGRSWYRIDPPNGCPHCLLEQRAEQRKKEVVGCLVDASLDIRAIENTLNVDILLFLNKEEKHLNNLLAKLHASIQKDIDDEDVAEAVI